MDFNVEHDVEGHQFYMVIEGYTCFLNYRILSDGQTLDYQITFVPPELRGRNLGQVLVKYALDYARDNQLKIIPTCPFIKKYIDSHPEYGDLVGH